MPENQYSHCIASAKWRHIRMGITFWIIVESINKCRIIIGVVSFFFFGTLTL